MFTQVKRACACHVLALSLTMCLLQPSAAMAAQSSQEVTTAGQTSEAPKAETEGTPQSGEAAASETETSETQTEAANIVIEPTESSFSAGMAAVIQENNEIRAAAEAQAAAETASQPQVISVAANVENALNIREEASEESAIVGKLYRGCVGEQLEAIDGWVKIQSGSVTGWVSTEYVKTGAEADQLIAEINPAVVTVNTDTLNVREQAGTDSNVLAVVSQGQTFMAREVGSEWVQIMFTPDITGYVASEFVIAENRAGAAQDLETLQALQEQVAQKEAERKAQEKKEEIAVTTGTPMLAAADDVTLLAAVCQYEAGNSYEGALAVANVVLNRVRSGSYPNSIAEVIYAPGQFGGARSGALNKYLTGGVSSAALQAANDALAGVNNVGDYTSFCSARIADINSYSSYVVIGGNCFYKR